MRPSPPRTLVRDAAYACAALYLLTADTAMVVDPVAPAKPVGPAGFAASREAPTKVFRHPHLADPSQIA
jgi:hypothetical protein